MKINVNENYKNVSQSYLFSEIGRRVREYQAEHPEKRVIRLGIGDVTLPLSRMVVDAMKAAAEEMADASTFRGYAPEYGYDFLREAVVKHYARRGAVLSADEVFISDGAKSDIGNIVDILGDNEIVVPDPVYPVYVDSNVMSGRHVSYLRATPANGFLPTPDEIPENVRGRAAVLYMCSPNNPTGAVYTRDGLAAWVAYARETGSLLLFDSAYEQFITDPALPHSIYEIEGAKECAIEICSLSKTAGFTGTRCGWTIVPEAITAGGMSLNRMWSRRQATKFNGVAYVVQRAAEAALSDEGLAQCREAIAYYMGNAHLIAGLCDEKGISYTGGKSSPYIWLRCPNDMKSWDFFDMLLNRAQVVGTPGAGFGACGEGFFRLTSFGSREATTEAVERLKKIL
ncbi:MAG: LL-diaminopimelate aminotransferase [Eubacteriales bacterium]